MNVRNLLLALLLGVSALARAVTPTSTFTPTISPTFSYSPSPTNTPSPNVTATDTPTVTATATPIQCANASSWVAEYNFQNNGNDSSGNNYNLTTEGTIPYSNVIYQNGSYSAGPFNTLPGPNYYLVPTAATLSDLNAFSVSFAFYNSDNTDDQYPYYELDGGSGQYIWIHIKNGKVYINAAGTSIGGVMPAADNAWHWITVTDSYNFTQLYVDTTLEAQGTLPYPTTATNAAYIGAYPGGPNGGSPVLTYLGAWFVYNCQLSSSEIATLVSTPTVTPTFSISPTYTLTPTPSWSPTLTATGTPTFTATLTDTQTSSPTPTWSPTSTFTITPNGTFTATPSNTPAYTHTFTPTTSPTPTPTWTPTITATTSPTATPTPTPSMTMTITPIIPPVCGSCVGLTGNYAPINMTWTAVQANPTAVVYQSNCISQPCDAYIAVPSSTTYTWMFWSMQPLGTVPGTTFSITPGGPYQAKLPPLKVGDQVSVQAVGAPTTPVTTPGTLRFDSTR